jgi:CDP-diacylglycerol--glycerol-3-phosphate 3-phosphatidyltransferase
VTPFGLGWPNIVSTFRIVLVPVIVVLLAAQTDATSYAAAAVFVAGGMTDSLDGYLARRHGTSTATGQWLDPLSDKLLVSAAALTLTALGRFPVWAAVIIVAREVIVSALRVVVGARGASMPASDIAKVKTWVQIVAITMYILPLSHGADDAKLAALIVAVIVTVFSGIDYFLRPRFRARVR